jgi:hypothetical protein
MYDNFGKAGYSLTDYNGKWMTPKAVPFQTGPDIGVDDHRRYLAVSTHTFPVPP